MLKVCVIGMGPIGNRHAKLYRESPLAELVGVCDINASRAAIAARDHHAPAFDDAKRMLDQLQPDIVSVTTSGVENGSDHYKPTIQALEAGAHVLCEKPICNEIAPAEEMVALAKEKGLCFGVDMNHRFTPAARVAKRWQNEGRIGHLLFLNMALWIMNRNESSPWFHIKSLHPHAIDILRHFGGDIDAVHCFATKAPGRKIWSSASFNLHFRNGAVGTLTGSYDIERGHPMERCEVAGTAGRLLIEDMWREATLFPADGTGEKAVYTNPVFGGVRDFEDTFRSRIHTFVEQVAAKTPPDQIDGSGADGLAAQKVLAAAVKSVETGQVVTVG